MQSPTFHLIQYKTAHLLLEINKLFAHKLISVSDLHIFPKETTKNSLMKTICCNSCKRDTGKHEK